MVQIRDGCQGEAEPPDRLWLGSPLVLAVQHPWASHGARAFTARTVLLAGDHQTQPKQCPQPGHRGPVPFPCQGLPLSADIPQPSRPGCDRVPATVVWGTPKHQLLVPVSRTRAACRPVPQHLAHPINVFSQPCSAPVCQGMLGPQHCPAGHGAAAPTSMGDFHTEATALSPSLCLGSGRHRDRLTEQLHFPSLGMPCSQPALTWQSHLEQPVEKGKVYLFKKTRDLHQRDSSLSVP